MLNHQSAPIVHVVKKLSGIDNSRMDLEDIDKLISDLPEEERIKLLASRLASEKPEVQSKILQSASPDPTIISYGSGSIVNSNSYHINASNAADAIDILVRLRQISRGQ